jgi:hypothetical protein
MYPNRTANSEQGQTGMISPLTTSVEGLMMRFDLALSLNLSPFVGASNLVQDEHLRTSSKWLSRHQEILSHASALAFAPPLQR